MRGLYLDQGTLAVRDDLPMPRRAPGEALVRVRLAGICHTDLEILRGYRPFRGIPGHEFVGTVVESDDRRWTGRRVVGEINVACGDCDLCAANMPTHCRRRAALGIAGRDGAMAEYLVLPQANLHPVPQDVEDEQAAFTEPLAAAMEIAAQTHVGPDDVAVVLGDGKLGLLVAQALSLTGCKTVAVGHHPQKLAIVGRRGIETLTDPGRLTGQADLVVECTGRPDGFADAMRIVRPRGRIIVKSTYVGRVDVDLSQIVVDEIHVLGSRCGPFGPALRLLGRGLVDVTSMIDSVYGLEDGLQAFGRAGEPGVLKVLLRP